MLAKPTPDNLARGDVPVERASRGSFEREPQTLPLGVQIHLDALAVVP